MIAHDWLDHDFINTRTVGFDETGRRWSRPTRPQKVSTPLRRPGGAHRRGRRDMGHGQDQLPACTPAASSTPPTARTTSSSYINLVLASGRIGRPGCGYGTLTGQGNGQGGREHGQKCDQLPGQRKYDDPEAASLHRLGLGHRAKRTSRPRAGHHRPDRADAAGRDPGHAQHLLQPDGLPARPAAPSARRSTRSNSTS